MINGRIYDWESIKVLTAWGAPLEIQGISYSSESAAELAYGRGRAARGFSRGNLTQSASMDLTFESFDTLSVYAATQGGIMNIKPFTIVVSYSNEDRVPNIDTLRSVIITKVETSAAQNDSEVRKMKLTLQVADPILYNGVAAL